MMINQEEQISRYFDHTMSSSEEQNFLITLAASDAMRIAFRSQLELMKAVRHDADRLRSVAAGRTTAVRDRTLTALGLSATAVAPFIEQEIDRSWHNATPSAPHQTANVSPVRGFFAKPKYALGTGLFLGFMSAVAVLNVAGPGHQTALVPPARVAPPVVVAPASVQNRADQETIPASSDLHKVADGRSSAVTGHAHVLAHPAVKSQTNSAAKSALPEVSTTNPAKVNVKTQINKPADDRSPADHSTKAP